MYPHKLNEKHNKYYKAKCGGTYKFYTPTYQNIHLKHEHTYGGSTQIHNTHNLPNVRAGQHMNVESKHKVKGGVISELGSAAVGAYLGGPVGAVIGAAAPKLTGAVVNKAVDVGVNGAISGVKAAPAAAIGTYNAASNVLQEDESNKNIDSTPQEETWKHKPHEIKNYYENEHVPIQYEGDRNYKLLNEQEQKLNDELNQPNLDYRRERKIKEELRQIGTQKKDYEELQQAYQKIESKQKKQLSSSQGNNQSEQTSMEQERIQGLPNEFKNEEEKQAHESFQRINQTKPEPSSDTKPQQEIANQQNLLPPPNQNKTQPKGYMNRLWDYGKSIVNNKPEEIVMNTEYNEMEQQRQDDLPKDQKLSESQLETYKMKSAADEPRQDLISNDMKVNTEQIINAKPLIEQRIEQEQLQNSTPIQQQQQQLVPNQIKLILDPEEEKKLEEDDQNVEEFTEEELQDIFNANYDEDSNVKQYNEQIQQQVQENPGWLSRIWNGVSRNKGPAPILPNEEEVDQEQHQQQLESYNQEALDEELNGVNVEKDQQDLENKQVNQGAEEDDDIAQQQLEIKNSKALVPWYKQEYATNKPVIKSKQNSYSEYNMKGPSITSRHIPGQSKEWWETVAKHAPKSKSNKETKSKGSYWDWFWGGLKNFHIGPTLASAQYYDPKFSGHHEIVDIHPLGTEEQDINDYIAAHFKEYPDITTADDFLNTNVFDEVINLTPPYDKLPEDIRAKILIYYREAHKNIYGTLYLYDLERRIQTEYVTATKGFQEYQDKKKMSVKGLSNVRNLMYEDENGNLVNPLANLRNRFGKTAADFDPLTLTYEEIQKLPEEEFIVYANSKLKSMLPNDPNRKELERKLYDVWNSKKIQSIRTKYPDTFEPLYPWNEDEEFRSDLPFKGNLPEEYKTGEPHFTHVGKIEPLGNEESELNDYLKNQQISNKGIKEYLNVDIMSKKDAPNQVQLLLNNLEPKIALDFIIWYEQNNPTFRTAQDKAIVDDIVRKEKEALLDTNIGLFYNYLSQGKIKNKNYFPLTMSSKPQFYDAYNSEYLNFIRVQQAEIPRNKWRIGELFWELKKIVKDLGSGRNKNYDYLKEPFTAIAFWNKFEEMRLKGATPEERGEVEKLFGEWYFKDRKGYDKQQFDKIKDEIPIQTPGLTQETIDLLTNQEFIKNNTRDYHDFNYRTKANLEDTPDLTHLDYLKDKEGNLIIKDIQVNSDIMQYLLEKYNSSPRHLRILGYTLGQKPYASYIPLNKRPFIYADDPQAYFDWYVYKYTYEKYRNLPTQKYTFKEIQRMANLNPQLLDQFRKTNDVVFYKVSKYAMDPGEALVRGLYISGQKQLDVDSLRQLNSAEQSKQIATKTTNSDEQLILYNMLLHGELDPKNYFRLLYQIETLGNQVGGYKGTTATYPEIQKQIIPHIAYSLMTAEQRTEANSIFQARLYLEQLKQIQNLLDQANTPQQIQEISKEYLTLQNLWEGGKQFADLTKGILGTITTLTQIAANPLEVGRYNDLANYVTETYQKLQSYGIKTNPQKVKEISTKLKALFQAAYNSKNPGEYFASLTAAEKNFYLADLQLVVDDLTKYVQNLFPHLTPAQKLYYNWMGHEYYNEMAKKPGHSVGYQNYLAEGSARTLDFTTRNLNRIAKKYFQETAKGINKTPSLTVPNLFDTQSITGLKSTVKTSDIENLMDQNKILFETQFGKPLTYQDIVKLTDKQVEEKRNDWGPLGEFLVHLYRYGYFSDPKHFNGEAMKNQLQYLQHYASFLSPIIADQISQWFELKPKPQGTQNEIPQITQTQIELDKQQQQQQFQFQQGQLEPNATFIESQLDKLQLNTPQLFPPLPPQVQYDFKYTINEFDKTAYPKIKHALFTKAGFQQKNYVDSHILNLKEDQTKNFTPEEKLLTYIYLNGQQYNMKKQQDRDRIRDHLNQLIKTYPQEFLNIMHQYPNMTRETWLRYPDQKEQPYLYWLADQLNIPVHPNQTIGPRNITEVQIPYETKQITITQVIQLLQDANIPLDFTKVKDPEYVRTKVQQYLEWADTTPHILKSKAKAQYQQTLNNRLKTGDYYMENSEVPPRKLSKGAITTLGQWLLGNLRPEEKTYFNQTVNSQLDMMDEDFDYLIDTDISTVDPLTYYSSNQYQYASIHNPDILTVEALEQISRVHKRHLDPQKVLEEEGFERQLVNEAFGMDGIALMFNIPEAYEGIIHMYNNIISGLKARGMNGKAQELKLVDFQDKVAIFDEFRTIIQNLLELNKQKGMYENLLDKFREGIDIIFQKNYPQLGPMITKKIDSMNSNDIYNIMLNYDLNQMLPEFIQLSGNNNATFWLQDNNLLQARNMTLWEDKAEIELNKNLQMYQKDASIVGTDQTKRDALKQKIKDALQKYLKLKEETNQIAMNVFNQKGNVIQDQAVLHQRQIITDRVDALRSLPMYQNLNAYERNNFERALKSLIDPWLNGQSKRTFKEINSKLTDILNRVELQGADTITSEEAFNLYNQQYLHVTNAHQKEVLYKWLMQANLENDITQNLVLEDLVKKVMNGENLEMILDELNVVDDFVNPVEIEPDQELKVNANFEDLNTYYNRIKNDNRYIVLPYGAIFNIDHQGRHKHIPSPRDLTQHGFALKGLGDSAVHNILNVIEQSPILQDLLRIDFKDLPEMYRNAKFLKHLTTGSLKEMEKELGIELPLQFKLDIKNVKGTKIARMDQNMKHALIYAERVQDILKAYIDQMKAGRGRGVVSPDLFTVTLVHPSWKDNVWNFQVRQNLNQLEKTNYWTPFLHRFIAKYKYEPAIKAEDAVNAAIMWLGLSNLDAIKKNLNQTEMKQLAEQIYQESLNQNIVDGWIADATEKNELENLHQISVEDLDKWFDIIEEEIKKHKPIEPETSWVQDWKNNLYNLFSPTPTVTPSTLPTSTPFLAPSPTKKTTPTLAPTTLPTGNTSVPSAIPTFTPVTPSNKTVPVPTPFTPKPPTFKPSAKPPPTVKPLLEQFEDWKQLNENSLRNQLLNILVLDEQEAKDLYNKNVTNTTIGLTPSPVPVEFLLELYADQTNTTVDDIIQSLLSGVGGPGPTGFPTTLLNVSNISNISGLSQGSPILGPTYVPILSPTSKPTKTPSKKPPVPTPTISTPSGTPTTTTPSARLRRPGVVEIQINKPKATDYRLLEQKAMKESEKGLFGAKITGLFNHGRILRYSPYTYEYNIEMEEDIKFLKEHIHEIEKQNLSYKLFQIDKFTGRLFPTSLPHIEKFEHYMLFIQQPGSTEAQFEAFVKSHSYAQVPIWRDREVEDEKLLPYSYMRHGRDKIPQFLHLVGKGIGGKRRNKYYQNLAKVEGGKFHFNQWKKVYQKIKSAGQPQHFLNVLQPLKQKVEPKLRKAVNQTVNTSKFIGNAIKQEVHKVAKNEIGLYNNLGYHSYQLFTHPGDASKWYKEGKALRDVVGKSRYNKLAKQYIPGVAPVENVFSNVFDAAAYVGKMARPALTAGKKVQNMQQNKNDIHHLDTIMNKVTEKLNLNNEPPLAEPEENIAELKVET